MQASTSPVLRFGDGVKVEVNDGGVKVEVNDGVKVEVNDGVYDYVAVEDKGGVDVDVEGNVG